MTDREREMMAHQHSAEETMRRDAQAQAVKETSIVCWQKVHAPHTPTGNPRRLYLVYGRKGNSIELIRVIDENYGSKPQYLKYEDQIHDQHCTATAYKEWLKLAEANEMLVTQ